MTSSSVMRMVNRLGAGALYCAAQVTAQPTNNENNDCLSESRCQLVFGLGMAALAIAGMYQNRSQIGHLLRWISNLCSQEALAHIGPIELYIPPYNDPEEEVKLPEHKADIAEPQVGYQR